MFTNLRYKIAQFIAPEYIKNIDNRVNVRVAKAMSEIDLFEQFMKEFNGVFSEEFEHVEDGLDEKSQYMMKLWGWQQKNDPSFQRITQWIMNTQGNETLKRAPVTEARIQYGRAQLSNMILYRKEVSRLASLYEDILKKKDEFNSEVVTE